MADKFNQILLGIAKFTSAVCFGFGFFLLFTYLKLDSNRGVLISLILAVLWTDLLNSVK